MPPFFGPFLFFFSPPFQKSRFDYVARHQSGSAAPPDVGDQTGVRSDSTLPFVAQMFSSEAPVVHAGIWWANLRPSSSSSSNMSRWEATGILVCHQNSTLNSRDVNPTVRPKSSKHKAKAAPEEPASASLPLSAPARRTSRLCKIPLNAKRWSVVRVPPKTPQPPIQRVN